MADPGFAIRSLLIAQHSAGLVRRTARRREDLSVGSEVDSGAFQASPSMRASSVGNLQTSACEAAQCWMWDLPPWLPPPTFLRPVIFSAVGRCGGSSGLNRASIHSLTCVREVEAVLSNGRRAWKKDLTHDAPHGRGSGGPA